MANTYSSKIRGADASEEVDKDRATHVAINWMNRIGGFFFTKMSDDALWSSKKNIELVIEDIKAKSFSIADIYMIRAAADNDVFLLTRES